MISVFASEASFLEYLGGFLVPATLGNTIGGVLLVTLLNYGQVAGSDKKTRLSGYTDENQESDRLLNPRRQPRTDCRSADPGLEYRGFSGLFDKERL